MSRNAFAGRDTDRCYNFVRVDWPVSLGLPDKARCDLVDGHDGLCRCRLGPARREVLIVFCEHDVGRDWTADVLELAELRGGAHVA